MTDSIQHEWKNTPSCFVLFLGEVPQPSHTEKPVIGTIVHMFHPCMQIGRWQHIPRLNLPQSTAKLSTLLMGNIYLAVF